MSIICHEQVHKKCVVLFLKNYNLQYQDYFFLYHILAYNTIYHITIFFTTDKHNFKDSCEPRSLALGSIPGLGRSPGEGNGYPLQYSDLENSMYRRAWKANGVAKSRTPLSNFHFQWLKIIITIKKKKPKVIVRQPDLKFLNIQFIVLYYNIQRIPLLILNESFGVIIQKIIIVGQKDTYDYC